MPILEVSMIKISLSMTLTQVVVEKLVGQREQIGLRYKGSDNPGFKTLSS
jgi:hypothetical protein